MNVAAQGYESRHDYIQYQIEMGYQIHFPNEIEFLTPSRVEVALKRKPVAQNPETIYSDTFQE